MTTTADATRLDDATDASALARCVGDAAAFTAESWGTRSHLHRGSDLTTVVTLDDVDHLVTASALRAPAFRVVRQGQTLPASASTRSARVGSRTITDLIDPAKVSAHLAEGATIVLQGLHRYWPPVTDLCAALERELTHPVQANAYLTPPVAQGLSVHGDPHDVFAIHTHGAKQWVVYEGDVPAADGSGADPTTDAVLRAGDVLYLPRGVHHAARTTDEPSLHLTIGVRAVTWRDVIDRVLSDLAEDDGLDAALPPGWADDPATLAQTARAHLGAMAARLAQTDPTAALVARARSFASHRPDDLRGQLRQTLAAGDIGDATTIRRRPNRRAQVTTDGDRVVITMSDRTLSLPAHAHAAVARACSGDDLVVGDLASHLDEPGRATLARRLVREGVCEIVGA